MRQLATLIFVMAVRSVAVAGDEQSWPQFHGPNRDSISTETGLLKEWPAEGPRLLWKYGQCGDSMANVSIGGGRIYTVGVDKGENMVIALDMDGKQLWRTPNGIKVAGATSKSNSTPTYHDGFVYHIGPGSRLAAFEAVTGREKWAVDLAGEFGARFGQYGISESVSVDGEQVICSPGGPKGLMVSLDRKTGATRRAVTQPDDHAAYCTPLLVTWQGVRQAITITRAFVISVDIGTGKLLWSRPFNTPKDGENAVTPVFQGGLVFVTTSHGIPSLLLKINKDQTAVSEVWATKEFGNCHGGVVLLNGNIYGSTCRGQKSAMCCVDFKTGAVRQVESNIFWRSLTYADGRLYCHTADGWMCLLEPSAEGFKTVSRFKMEGSYVHPVVCGGRLYVRCRFRLYVYDIRGGDVAATRPDAWQGSKP